MSIRNDSKKIIRFLLDTAVKCGDLTKPSIVRYENLVESLALENEPYCKVCVQYLSGKGLIHVHRNPDETRTMTLNVTAIDFLEAD